MDKGGSKGHKYANAPNKQPSQVIAPGSTSMDAIRSHHSDIWEKEWSCESTKDVQEGIELVSKIRSAVIRDPSIIEAAVARVDAVSLDTVLRKFKTNTGIGDDGIAIQRVCKSSPEAKYELISIIKDVIRSVAVPLQDLLVVMPLIAKKLGGARTVGLAGSVHRITMALLLPDIRGWDKKHANTDDTAVSGKSLEIASAHRFGLLESLVAGKRKVALLLWDGRKFFDKLNFVKVFRRAMADDFPLVPLALAGQVAKAPRVLRYGEATGRIIGPTGTSILPGCCSPPSLARVAVNGMVRRLQSEARSFQHVDDVTQMVQARSNRELTKRAARAGREYARVMTDDGNELAPKSAVITQSPQVSNNVAHKLRKDGVPVQAVKAYDVVGVATSAGGRRMVKSQWTRILKGRARSARIGHMSRRNPKAGRLFTTGSLAMMRYGTNCMGSSTAMRMAMRRAAKSAIAAHGHHTCAASLIWWKLGGARRDPCISELLLQLKTFVRMVRGSTAGERRLFAMRWRQLSVATALNGMGWAQTNGPLDGMILTLAEYG